MNIVNPSKGLVTASSRFGALLLKKDGSVVVPYNVRVTQSLLDIFGDKVAWLSKAQVVNNTSQSYGARNPTASRPRLYAGKRFGDFAFQLIVLAIGYNHSPW